MGAPHRPWNLAQNQRNLSRVMAFSLRETQCHTLTTRPPQAQPMRGTTLYVMSYHTQFPFVLFEIWITWWQLDNFKIVHMHKLADAFELTSKYTSIDKPWQGTAVPVIFKTQKQKSELLESILQPFAFKARECSKVEFQASWTPESHGASETLELSGSHLG